MGISAVSGASVVASSYAESLRASSASRTADTAQARPMDSDGDHDGSGNGLGGRLDVKA